MDCVVGKVVLVTGGAGGIGLAMVKQLLQNGAKAAAVVDSSDEAGRRAIDEITSTFGEGKTVFIKADITIKEELEGAFETTIQIYKHLDIVINNAGILDEINWQKTVAVNLSAVIEGSYLAMQKYLPNYKSGKEGVIVNVASVCGLQTMQVAPVYCATKHGVIGLGRTLCGEAFYKKYNVRILTICPGVVQTKMIENKEGLLFPEIHDRELTKLNRIFLLPERVAEALIEAIQKGRNGSLWVIEDDEPVYEIEIPHYRNTKV